MKIGQVAALSGVPTATVRFYERTGLVEPAPRTPSGYRQYDGETVRRLRFIRHAQRLGFTLRDIQAMLDLRADDPHSCERAVATTRERARAVRQHLRELQRLERTLHGLLTACERSPSSEPCPILRVLADDETATNARRRRA